MSEWVSVFAVFWILWLLDGVRVAPRRLFTWTGGGGPRHRARVVFSRVSLPGWWPAHWRIAGADVPLSLSPVGVCNQPVGSAGRPAEVMAEVVAWRWSEIREVGVAQGWIYINGARFCPDTGHLSAPALLALAQAPADQRERRVQALIARWLRPAHVARRVKVLMARTALPAALNRITFLGWVALTVYVVGDFASRIPAEWSERLVTGMPFFVLGLLALHVVAVISAWRQVRKLKAVAPQKRGMALFSALLLPPQALRIRTLMGDGFFPAQHPLGVTLGFAGPKCGREVAFAVLADLAWPLPAGQSPLAREISGWFRQELEPRVRVLVSAQKIDPNALLAAPLPDAPASASYCPRCGAQFVAREGVCPNGVPLRPLSGR